MKENAKIRETEEKIRRAREAKERAQKEKAAKMARKKAIVDMTMGKSKFTQWMIIYSRGY